MASPAVPFSDEEFREASKEIEYPDLRGYEVFVDSQGVKIYRHYIEVR